MSTLSSSAATTATATATGTGTAAALSGSGSSASTVAKPPSLNVRVHRFDLIKKIIPRFSRATRNTKPRCLHFAPSRAEFQQKYPDHFFCSKCENLYQTWVIDGADDSCHVDSSRFMCEATHDNFISPSQLRPDVIAAMNRNVLDDDDVSIEPSEESYYGSDDDNNTSKSTSTSTSTTTTNNNNTTAARKQLKRNTVSLEKEASTTNREVKKMKNNCTEDEQGVARILKSYQELITELKSKLKYLEEVIKKKDIYIGELERSATK
jgi:hypothetical protein